MKLRWALANGGRYMLSKKKTRVRLAKGRSFSTNRGKEDNGEQVSLMFSLLFSNGRRVSVYLFFFQGILVISKRRDMVLGSGLGQYMYMIKRWSLDNGVSGRGNRYLHGLPIMCERFNTEWYAPDAMHGALHDEDGCRRISKEAMIEDITSCALINMFCIHYQDEKKYVIDKSKGLLLPS